MNFGRSIVSSRKARVHLHLQGRRLEESKVRFLMLQQALRVLLRGIHFKCVEVHFEGLAKRL